MATKTSSKTPKRGAKSPPSTRANRVTSSRTKARTSVRATTRGAANGFRASQNSTRAKAASSRVSLKLGLDLDSMISPCLWFDGQAEEAARFYVSLFPDSKVDAVARSPADYPSGKKGDVLAVDFTLRGQRFKALNGGPYFKFNEAVSFVIPCDDQAEVDRYLKAFSAVPGSEQCGWVKDKYGLSWQIVPKVLYTLLSDRDAAKAGRVMEAMLKMKRLDIGALQRAAK